MQEEKTLISRDIHKKLTKIIYQLMQNDQSFEFRKPVPYKQLGLEDYLVLIEKPMDLNTVQQLFKSNKYEYIEDALNDIQLIWDNCKVYNAPGSQIYQLAQNMEDVFQETIRENFENLNIKIKPKEIILPVSSQNIEPQPKKKVKKEKKKPEVVVLPMPPVNIVNSDEEILDSDEDSYDPSQKNLKPLKQKDQQKQSTRLALQIMTKQMKILKKNELKEIFQIIQDNDPSIIIQKSFQQFDVNMHKANEITMDLVKKLLQTFDSKEELNTQENYKTEEQNETEKINQDLIS